MSADRELAFVDTNVLVYAFERKDSPKRQTAQRLLAALMDGDRLRLSTQVLQELYVTLTRKVKRPCSSDEAIGILESLNAWPLTVVDYGVIRAAAGLSEDARVSFWDAMIVVAATRSGASLLYSEDLNHGQEILGVRVVNPFL